MVKVIRLGPEQLHVVLNGLGRFRVAGPLALEPYMKAKIERISEVAEPRRRARRPRHRRSAKSTREVLGLMPNLPKETAGILDNVREPGALADLIASNFPQEHASASATSSRSSRPST